MELKVKLDNTNHKWKRFKKFFAEADLSDINKYYKKILKRLPDISHLKNIVVFSGIATLIIFVLFAQRFSTLYEYLPTKPAYGGSYSEGTVGNIKQLNPLFSPTNPAEDSAVALLFSGLTKNIENRGVEGNLASNWEISKDKKTYTFKLKDNLAWHDGEKLDADDVYFTYKTIQNPDANSPRLATWKNVNVEILDEKTVSFTLPGPLASFIFLTDVPIVPEHILGKIPVSNLRASEFSTNPIGSGPYVFDELKTVKDSQEVHMIANESYHEGQPYIGEFAFKSYPNYGSLTSAYNKKDVKGIARLRPYDIDREDHLPNIKVKNLVIPEYDALFFNLASDFTKEKTLREAISLAIDKKSVIKEVYYGEAVVIHSAILPGYLGYNGELRQLYNLEKAQKKLAAAGYSLDGEKKLVKDGKVVTLRLVSVDEELKLKEANLLAKMIGELGINVNVESYPIKTYIEEMVRPRNYDLILATQNLGSDPDIYTFYHANMATDPGLNLSGIKIRQIDKYLEDARTSHDQKYREARYKDISKFINAETAATYLCWPSYLYGVSNDVKGVGSMKISNPKDRFWNVAKWYVEADRDY